MTPSLPCALIADDDAFFRIALGALLTGQLGFATILEAGSLDDALDLLGTRPEISLALFDLSMPGMKQAASLAAVRECAGHVTLAVVSGSSARADILGALGAGVHGYIPKALGPRELVTALETVLSGQIYVPPVLAQAGPSEQVAAPASGDRAKEALSRLTKRQREVLQELVAGRSNKEIARRLDLGEGTVKIHVASLLRALQLPNRAAAAAFGARESLD
jgi:DNA-binding NarL/FixJ family response regulator